MQDPREASLQADDLGRRLNAVITVDPDGLAGKLDGVPLLVKDCIAARGMPVTYGSAIEAQSAPVSEDAFVVSRAREAGFAIIGKASLTEYCFGATGENAHFGNVRNPWDPDRITGGSSSGSAAAVAAGIVPCALGTDTGGSVRVPASLCGVVGLRPTIGRVSNHGCLDVSSAYDTIGPIAQDVETAARLYDAIQGYDPRDPLSIPAGESACARINGGVSGLTVGVLRPYYCDESDPAVVAAFENAVSALKDAGAETVDAALGTVEERREQGAIRFIAADVADARSDLRLHRRDEVGAEFLRRLDVGAAVTGTEYARSFRSLLTLRRQLRDLFESGIDVLVTPTCPVTAPLWSDATDMIATTRLVARFTYDIGAAGVPALQVPIALDPEGMPIGMQLIGAWGEDALLFQAARAIEEAMNFKRHRPTINVTTSDQLFE